APGKRPSPLLKVPRRTRKAILCQPLSGMVVSAAGCATVRQACERPHDIHRTPVLLRRRDRRRSGVALPDIALGGEFPEPEIQAIGLLEPYVQRIPQSGAQRAQAVLKRRLA